MFEVKTELKDFQKDTVEWMKDRERGYDGGFLLNEAGTGKTLCCLSLMINENNNNENNKTLIVCPAGLVENWKSEIKKHTNCYDSVYTFDKNSDPTAEKTICIASYSKLVNYSKVKADHDFLKTRFHRIILDEAHYIRNARGKRFNHVLRLNAKNKWVVTATPIFNTPKDLYAYFRFLELEGIDSHEAWKILTKRSGIRTYKIINQTLEKHSIKYEKKEILKNLKPKKIITTNVEMTDTEKIFYKSLYEYCSNRIILLNEASKKLSRSHPMRRVFTMNILVYILRLKQCSDSPLLVIQSLKRLHDSYKTTNHDIYIENATEMLDFYNLSENTKEECPICYDKDSDVIFDPCGHKCCSECLNKLTKFNILNCPTCRTEINSVKKLNTGEENVNNILSDCSDVVQAENTIARLEHMIDETRSSKISALLNIVHDKLDVGEKIVIVSQWVEMLKITKEHLKDIQSVTLTGQVNPETRQKLIENFQTDPSIKICYLSMMSSAEGINLTAANNLVLLDSWWNNSKMLQVSERIHRIGQDKQVTIYNLVVNDSIETKIKDLVKLKTKVSDLLTTSWKEEENYDDSWLADKAKIDVWAYEEENNNENNNEN